MKNDPMTGNRIRRRLAFLVVLAALIGGNMFFLFKRLSLKLPAELESLLHSKSIEIRKQELETSLLPFPHLVARRLVLYIDNQVNLEFKDAHFYLNFLSLFTGSRQKLSLITVHSAVLHVEDVRKPEKVISRVFRKKRDMIGRILYWVNLLVDQIPRQFNLTNSLTAGRFTLYADFISKEKPLLSADEISLKQGFDGKIRFFCRAFMGEWVTASVRILARPGDKQGTDWLDSADTEVRANVDFEKLPASFPFVSARLSGRAEVAHDMFIRFPLKKVEHRGKINVEKFRLGFTGKKQLRILPEDRFSLEYAGFADNDGVFASPFSIKMDQQTVSAEFSWIFRDYTLLWDFQNLDGFSSHKLFRLAGLSSKVWRSIRDLGGNVKPVAIRWNPWKGEFDWNLRFFQPLSRRPGGLFLQGNFHGRNFRVRSTDSIVRGSKTKLMLKQFSLQLLPVTVFRFQTRDFLVLEDLTDQLRGPVFLRTTVNCEFTESENLNCRGGDFYANGEDLSMRAGTTARFYRLLSINFFSYWKSLKPSSEIDVSSFRAKGVWQKNGLNIDTLNFRSDIGNYYLNGQWRPLENGGEFILRFSPLNMDKVFEPIPVVGTVLNESLAFATQMIFRLQLNNGEFKVKSFNFGKGMEKVRNIFNR